MRHTRAHTWISGLRDPFCGGGCSRTGETATGLSKCDVGERVRATAFPSASSARRSSRALRVASVCVRAPEPDGGDAREFGRGFQVVSSISLPSALNAFRRKLLLPVALSSTSCRELGLCNCVPRDRLVGEC